MWIGGSPWQWRHQGVLFFSKSIDIGPLVHFVYIHGP
jgi:hypothetical protein